MMLKAVLQAIPTYSMGIFLLPKIVLSYLNTLLKPYWCGSNGEHSKTHWLKWSILGLPKSEGGLGFRNMVTFNLALLSKQAWIILQNHSSLVSRVFK